MDVGNNLKDIDKTITLKYNCSIMGREEALYKVYFYRDRNGCEPVAEYITQLAKKQDKDSHIKLNKIRDYIKILSEYGT